MSDSEENHGNAMEVSITCTNLFYDSLFASSTDLFRNFNVLYLKVRHSSGNKKEQSGLVYESGKFVTILKYMCISYYKMLMAQCLLVIINIFVVDRLTFSKAATTEPAMWHDRKRNLFRCTTKCIHKM